MVGPNAEPNAAHAHSTSAIMPLQFGLSAITSATTEITATIILPAQSISLSEAFFRKTGLYTSDANAEEDAKSWESAVLMEAAKIAESRAPESNAGNRLLTIYIKIRLLLPSSR